MSTSLKSKKEIQQAFREILTPAKDHEKLEVETFMLMARFLTEIEKVCEERGLLKKELAQRIGTSASYITQLFRGHKIINLETIAKIMLALEIQFDVQIKKKTESSFHNEQDYNDTKRFRLQNEKGYWKYTPFLDEPDDNEEILKMHGNETQMVA
jgi:transcriptional regulator with XRE-family HTH domain